jgi:hypothetical protein
MRPSVGYDLASSLYVSASRAGKGLKAKASTRMPCKPSRSYAAEKVARNSSSMGRASPFSACCAQRARMTSGAPFMISRCEPRGGGGGAAAAAAAGAAPAAPPSAAPAADGVNRDAAVTCAGSARAVAASGSAMMAKDILTVELKGCE